MKYAFKTVFFVLILLTSLANSQENISIQGYLTDGAGETLSNGNYSIEFKIYNVSSGGTALWTETQTVSVSDGIFNVHLGSVNALNIDFDIQYWVGLSIEGDPELAPRIKLTYSPYSMYAVAIADNSVNSNKIENGTITGEDFSQMGAMNGQSLIWNGTNWTPDNESDPTWNGSNDNTGNIYRSGNVGIGTNNPVALLHTNETGTGEGNVLFEGEYKTSNPGDPPVEGEGTRMMWYPDKAAFRAGYVAGAQWNKDEIGDYSFASGQSTTASGFNSTTLGNSIVAPSGYETVIGRLNSIYTPVSTTGWDSSDRLFVVGNGIDPKTRRSNALTILKNGNMGIGTDIPDEKLVIAGSIKMQDGNQSVGYIPISDADGKMMWTNPNMITNADADWIVKNDTLFNNTVNYIGIGTDTPTALLHANGTGTGEGNILFEGDFVVTSPGDPPASGEGTRMMWYPNKSAFRVGYVNGTQWDKDNIGSFSVAMGGSTQASGYYSTATGFGTIASSWASTSMGYFSNATGGYSTAIGQITTASGYNSVAIGNNTVSKSAYETVIGRYNTDYIPNDENVWNANDRLFVVGNGTNSNAKSNALTILKNGNIGIGTDNPQYRLHLESPETQFHTALFIEASSQLSKRASMRIDDWNILQDITGNGTRNFAIYQESENSQRFVINENGNIGIGTIEPTALLHINGTGTGDGNVLFTGERKTTDPGDPPAEGAGTRMIWYPDKAAFRAGYVTDTQWDKDSIGISSISMGVNTKANGYNSTALGQATTASDTLSTAFGSGTVASKDYATAMGRSTTASGTAAFSSGILSTASGEYGTAMGYNSLASGTVSVAIGNESKATATYGTAFGYFTTASGEVSTSMGANTEAESGFETVVGRWNTDYTPNSTNGWNTDDRLFVVGNGTGSGSRSNAMTIMKNGRVGLQTVTAPTFALELPNNSSDGIGKGRANAWTTYSDARIKSEIKQISYGLAEIMQIEPLKYFQHNSDLSSGNLELSNDGSNNIGFIAQDIYKIIPELVTKPENENSDLWSVSYDKLTPVLVKAVQEQQEIIDKQNEKISELESKYNELLLLIKNSK